MRCCLLHAPFAMCRLARLLPLLALLTALPLHAQPRDAAEQGAPASDLPRPAQLERLPLRFDRVGRDEGLSSSRVLDVVQDDAGYIWMATMFGSGGIERYDGYQSKLYPVDNFDYSTGLAFVYPEVLLVGSDGTLWAGGKGGLSRYDAASDRFVRVTGAGLEADSLHVWRIAESREGRLWIATLGKGVARFDPATGEGEWFRHDPADPTSLCSNSVFQPYEDRSGTLWLPTANGLCRFDSETQGFTRHLHDADQPEPIWMRDAVGMELGASPRSVYSVVEDAGKDGLFWAWTRQGLLRFDPQAGGAETVLPNRADDYYGELLGDLGAPRRLWLATLGDGLYHVDTETGESVHYTHDPQDERSLPSDYLSSIYRDHAGLIWLGSRAWHRSGESAIRFDPRGGGLRHLALAPAGPLPREGVQSILEDRQGQLWVGMERGILARVDRQSGAAKTWRLGPDRPDNWVGHLLEDRTGTLWATSDIGLHRYDPETEAFRVFQPYPDEPVTDLKANWIVHPYEDTSGVLFACGPSTDSTGAAPCQLFRFDAARERLEPVEPAPHPNEGHPPFAFPLMRDLAGRTWWRIAGRGLAAVSADTVHYFVHDPEDPESLSPTNSGYYAQRPEEPDVMWVPTIAGLNRLDLSSGEISRLTRDDGLPAERLLDALPGADGELWISSTSGLLRFDPDDTTFTVFGPNDGAQTWHFRVRTAYKSRSGELFFGGWNGLNMFYPSQLRPNPHPPKVGFTGLRLFGEEILPDGEDSPLRGPLDEAEAVRLRHDQNVVTFAFSALHFRNPEGNRTAYQLVGIDRGWTEAGGHHEATYTHLPPDDYQFRVKAANSDGVWSAPRTVRLTVLPPWWRAWWAYLVYGLLLTAGVVAADRIQRRRLIRKEQEKMRERELAHAREIEATNERLRASEQQLKEQARRLRELDQLKSRFFANISHEFRTPLTLVLGPLRDAQAGRFGPLGERLRAQLALMQHNAERLLSLIGQLLDLSRLEAGSMGLRAPRGDLAQFVQRIVRTFSSRAEREEITLQFSTAQGEIPCYFDPDKLEKVIYNLLSNAFKFTPARGKIRIELGVSSRDGAEVAQILVRDTGEGIPEEELTHIFDRFHQVDASATRRHDGTGIGLALARELVELHAGSIDVESAVGFGTTFTVRLPLGKEHLRPEELVEEPLSEAAADDAPVERATMADTAGVPAAFAAEAARPDGAEEAGGMDEGEAAARGPVVLVVEDNAEMRAYVKSHLQGRYRVEEAADGAEALEQARARRPDLVISDVMMPEIDGFALCRALKSDEALSDVPVILLTARAGEEAKLEGLETGADDYLTKPFSAEELMARAENLIELRRALRRRFSEEVVIGPSEVVATPQDAAFLERVRAVVEAHMAETSFTVDRLAEEVGLSTRQLHRRMLELTELTPAAYVRMMRLERAAQLLAQQAGGVSEVAYAVGFQNANYFSRLFKQTFGSVPSEFSADRA